MKFNKSVGLQAPNLTSLQKSFFAPGDPDGAKVYDSITVIDEAAGREFTMFANRADLRQVLIEAEQRGDVKVRPGDAALIDSGRIRKGLAEALYPGAVFPGDEPTRDEDGSPMIKSKTTDVVKKAYRAHASRPGLPMADLRAAAEELDLLVKTLERR